MNQIIPKTEYYRYNYHSNLIQICEDWRKKNKNLDVNNEHHRKIITQLHHSLKVKDAIDVMWRKNAKSEDNQKLLKDIEPTLKKIKPTDLDSKILEKFPFMKQFLNENSAQNDKPNEQPTNHTEITHQYLTMINAERVYLSVVRSFFSYLLRNSWYFDSVRQLNTFSLLLANYLYLIRFNLNLYIMLTIENSAPIAEMSYWERAYGYLIANLRQFLNDFFWISVLLAVSFHIYTRNISIQKFFSHESTSLGINIFIGITLLFDVWNAWQAVKELDDHWASFIDENKDLKNDLWVHYQKIRREKIALVNYTISICGVNLISGILDVSLFLAENNHSSIAQSVAHLIPFLNIAFIGLMFISQIIFLTREYWDEDFIKLPDDEKNKIKSKAISQATEEVLKILIIALIVFVIASQIPLGGIPQMLVLALLTIALIAFVKIMKEYLEPKMMELINPTEDVVSPTAKE